MAQLVRVDAPAKVNLRLCVLAREASGYHSLESLFCAVSLADRLEITRSGPGIRLEVEGGIDTGPPERNLVVRAARRFYRGIGEEPAIRILLRKRVPAAAGLGGGSSDAGATLRALHVLHGIPPSPATLLQWATEIGSDVPFFVCPSPYALAWGRGQRLLALHPPPARPVLIVDPRVAMPTADAFSRLARRRGESSPPRAAALAAADLHDWNTLADLAVNDFETLALEELPRLARAKSAMQDHGAYLSLLSGSGSALFGIFPDEDSCAGAALALEALSLRPVRCHTLTQWGDPEAGPA